MASEPTFPLFAAGFQVKGGLVEKKSISSAKTKPD